MLFPFQIQFHLLSEKRKLAVKKYHSPLSTSFLTVSYCHFSQVIKDSSLQCPLPWIVSEAAHVGACVHARPGLGNAKWDGREKPMPGLSSASHCEQGCPNLSGVPHPLQTSPLLLNLGKGWGPPAHGNGQKGNENFPSPSSFPQTCHCIPRVCDPPRAAAPACSCCLLSSLWVTKHGTSLKYRRM